MKFQEKTIAAFLYVWENQPEVFYNSGAIDGLTKLQDELIKAPIASVEEIFAILDRWCENYEEVTKAVVSANNRKFDPANNIPSQQEESKTLDNRYPQISQILRDRLPRDREEEVKPK